MSEFQREYIASLKEQIETMKKLNKLNDDIIKAKDEHIVGLERVIEELHGLVRRSIDLAEKQL